MRIVGYRVHHLYSLGNYENEKVEVEAVVEASDDHQAVLDYLFAHLEDNHPKRREARAIVANPDAWSRWEVVQAYKRLGLDLPPELAPRPAGQAVLDEVAFMRSESARPDSAMGGFLYSDDAAPDDEDLVEPDALEEGPPAPGALEPIFLTAETARPDDPAFATAASGVEEHPDG